MKGARPLYVFPAVNGHRSSVAKPSWSLTLYLGLDLGYNSEGRVSSLLFSRRLCPVAAAFGTRLLHYPTQGEKPGFLSSQAKNLVSDFQCRVMNQVAKIEGGPP